MPKATKDGRIVRRNAQPLDAAKVVLGETYTDIVTGIKGVAVIVYIHLTGCDQVCLEYVESGCRKNLVIDATRLAEITPSANPRSGGPGAPVPSRLP
jgi:hypothetical protein